MYSFPIGLLPFLGVINLFGDVIITVINGYICPNANVTIDIQSTMIPKWQAPELDESGCQTCRDTAFFSWFDTVEFTFYNSNADQEITGIERIQLVDGAAIQTIRCYFEYYDMYDLLGKVKVGFQMNSDHAVTDQLIGINVPWLWEWDGYRIAISHLHINIEQNDNYPYNVKSPDKINKINCESNLTYSITVEQDCPPLQETIKTTIFTSKLTNTQTAVNVSTTIPSQSHRDLKKDNQGTETITETTRSKSNLTTTKVPKTKANNKKNEKPTTKKIDPRLINSLAVSGSAVIIVIVVSLVMYFGWYRRKLNQLGLLPQNATPMQN